MNRRMMSRLLRVAGLLLMAAAGVWRLGVSDRLFTQRFPDGWTWGQNSVGYIGTADPETGQFAPGTTVEDEALLVIQRSLTARASADAPGQVIMTDAVAGVNALTKAVQWEGVTEQVLDSTSARYIGGDYAGDYYLLPRAVDRSQVYSISNLNYQRLPLTFQREEIIEGIRTYLFAYQGVRNSALAYGDSVALEPGQDIECLDLDVRYWVEPETGEIVRFREWCEGDWVFNSATGEPIYALTRWGGESSAADQMTNAQVIQAQLNSEHLQKYGVPWMLLIAGGGAAAAGLFLGRQPRPREERM